MNKKTKGQITTCISLIGKRFAAILDIVALVCALAFILAACTAANTRAQTASPAISESPAASAESSIDPTPSAASSPAPLPYPDYTLGSGSSEKIHLGVQDGLFPWGYTYEGAGITSSTSGDMPGTVFYKVSGDQYRLFYRHIEETGKDVISAFMTSSDTCKTERGIGNGDTVERLLETYNNGLLYIPKPFPISRDQGGDFCVYDELFVYTQPEDDNCCIIFYVVSNIDSKVITGIQISLGQDGGPAFIADNVNTISVDYTHLDQYLKTDTRAEEKVHALFQANSAVDKSALLEAMTAFNWRLYDQLYHSDAVNLIDWLYQQKFTSDNEILCVLKATKGLDGGYSEGYSDILANIFKADNQTFIKLASQLDDSRIDTIAQMLCYGIADEQAEVISVLKAFENSGGMTEKELLVIGDILFYFDAWYSN